LFIATFSIWAFATVCSSAMYHRKSREHESFNIKKNVISFIYVNVISGKTIMHTGIVEEDKLDEILKPTFGKWSSRRNCNVVM